MRRVLTSIMIATAIALVPVTGASASPTQPPAPQQERVSRDCYSAIDVWWPASSRAWAKKIVFREARNLPHAANRRSTARGCFQLLMSLHAHRYNKFRAFGCHPGKWANADCNTLAALSLFQTNGTRPWAVTRYTR